MRPKSRKDFAIAIICALPLEADAVEALFDEPYDRLGKHYGKQRGDANAYTNGKIGKHDVVLCYMPGMGKGNAAGVVASLKVSYPAVELALVVGICGGAPPPPKYHKIFLGDVIIGDSVVEYDFGTQYPGGFQRKTGIQDTLGRPGREIRALLNGLRAENARRELQNQTQQYLHILQQRGAKWHRPNIEDILFSASYLHKHHSYASTGCSCLGSDSPDNICEEALRQSCNKLECNKDQTVRYREPSEAVQTSLYIGTVASADTVMKSGQHRDEIVRKENAIGFEMEGAGVWDHVSCIIIKGVCDYADSHKNKLWQAYAAATGASAAKAFLEYWMPVNHEDTSKTRHLMIPFERNTCFVGRHDEIQKLEDLISVPDRAKKLAITGLGGVGKTQVALELAYRMRDREPECSIFWIPCTSSEAVEQACMAIAQMVGLQDVKPAEVKECIKTYFSRNDEKWLLIFDNADDIDMWVNGNDNTLPLKDFLPVNNHGHIIFTTRNRELAVDLASPYVTHVRELDEKTGVEFLEKSLVRTDLLHDSRTTIALLEQLTFLPLAISQAIAYINKKDITLSDYLVLLEEQEADVVELLSKDFGDDGRYKDMQNPIAKTWLISFSQIRKLDQLAAEYLSLMACVNPRNIPQTFLPQPGSRLKMTDALGLLSAYSFITIQPGNRCISLHRLVHLATRNWMRKEEQFSVYIIKTADRLNEVFPHSDHINRRLWRDYLPHALSLLSEREFGEQQEKYIDCIENVGSCLYSDGRYDEAERLLVKVMTTRKQVLGPEHPETLASMNNLSITYQSQARWKEAEELLVQVMEIAKQVLGPKHPSTLASINNLSNTYQNQRRWKEAEELGVQVMEIRKQVLGPKHPDTLASMNNLSITYQSQGRWKEAEELGVQVMETRKQVLGPEHPDTLASMNNLSSIYRNQGQWKEAEELGVQVMKTMKQALGPEHPDTLISMNNLSNTYRNERRWEEAEELQIQVMETGKQALGLEHPNTLTSMINLSSIYRNQRRWKEAEELLVQVIEIGKQVLGPEHPTTLTSMNNLSLTYQNEGRWKEAEELGVQVMETRKQVLGTEHPDTLASMNNLSSTYQSQGQWKEAEELLVQVIKIGKQVLGPGHPDTLISMNNLSVTYQNQGRWEEAEELQMQVIETGKQMLGLENSNNLTSMINLSRKYQNQERWEEAEKLLRQIIQTHTSWKEAARGTEEFGTLWLISVTVIPPLLVLLASEALLRYIL